MENIFNRTFYWIEVSRTKVYGIAIFKYWYEFLPLNLSYLLRSKSAE